MSEEVKSESEKKKEDWMNSKWRPMMGWMYMMVCMCDFILFPVLWSLLHAVLHTANMTQWNPLTLQGAGLFHIAMGAVLGIAAFGRTQEKLGGANNGGIQTPATGFPSGPPAFGQPQSGGFGSSGGFNSPAPSTSYAPAPSWGTTPVAAGGFGAPATGQVVAGFGGKPAPMQPEQPQI
jgi:hypothetical protein